MIRGFIVLCIISSVLGFRFLKPIQLVQRAGSNAQLNSIKIIDPIFEDKCDMTGITLTRYMVETVLANPQLRELESLIMSIQTACKTISHVVEKASISGLTGLEEGGGSINVQGEEQKRLDVVTNDIMKKALRFSGKVGVLASEEEDKPMSLDGNQAEKYRELKTTQFKQDVLIEETGGKYIAVFDPLDGSSNVDAGIPTGTIFGIFEEDPNATCEIPLDDSKDADENYARCLAGTLRPGNSLVAAGYCLYSSSTFLCITLGNGVNIFTLDPSIGEFILTHRNVKIPSRGKIYSFNEANRFEWEQPLVDYVSALQQGIGESGVKYSGRYIGSMVGDVHRTLLYGGIFGYPGTKKTPNGKLRLLYEAAPMSFLVEQAGGLSTTGRERIMDIVPKNVHQRVPCLLGSHEDINEVVSYYKKADGHK
jgi:fructose-1,6-bisphosphatase I